MYEPLNKVKVLVVEEKQYSKKKTHLFTKCPYYIVYIMNVPGINARVKYFIIGAIRVSLSEGMENIPQPPFLLDEETGSVFLNFDPQKSMKGYFDFIIMANDTGGLSDTAKVVIYLLREDQKVKFVLRQSPPELREKVDSFRR